MADRILRVEVASYRGRLWHNAGSSIQIPVVGGQLGVSPGRQPLPVILKAGTVTVQTSQEAKTFEVEGGFASVDSDFVTAVADHVTAS